MTFRFSANGLHYCVSWFPKRRPSLSCKIPILSRMTWRAREIEEAARTMGQKIVIFKAAREQEIDSAFSAIMRSGAGALHVGAGPFINSRRSQLVGLAAFHAIPASYFTAGFVEAGGLMSYGSS